MQLTVLGAQGTWPGAGGENCGYLITQDGYHLQVDAGTGTFARLQQVVGVDDVGAFVPRRGSTSWPIPRPLAFYEAVGFIRVGEAQTRFGPASRMSLHLARWTS